MTLRESTWRRLGRVTLIGACAMVASACPQAGSRLRDITYGSGPGSLRYLTQHEIRSTMQQLAQEVYTLDDMMIAAADGETIDSAAVLETLRNMRRLTSSLSKGEATNHPHLDAYLPALQDDIDRAIGGASASPPSYYFAGTVSGACEYCHAPPVIDQDGTILR
jgi:hypothetical protein